MRIVDIDIDAAPLDDVALRVAERVSAAIEHAVVAPNAEIQLQPLPGAYRVVPPFPDGFAVLRMDTLQPMRSRQGFRGHTNVFRPTPIQELAMTILPGHPDH
jgi:hypothetical protein